MAQQSRRRCGWGEPSPSADVAQRSSLRNDSLLKHADDMKHRFETRSVETKTARLGRHRWRMKGIAEVVQDVGTRWHRGVEDAQWARRAPASGAMRPRLRPAVNQRGRKGKPPSAGAALENAPPQ
jgi:hypothetical protein